MIEVVTIGVYGTTEASFFEALTQAGVSDFVDIRRRRGMRGKQYAYANATYLANKLKELGIRYHHVIDLAPSPELRSVQKNQDSDEGTSKRDRSQLSDAFVNGYHEECLAAFDLNAFLETFPASAKLALFCVERAPEACHRSIVAATLSERHQLSVRDITP